MYVYKCAYIYIRLYNVLKNKKTYPMFSLMKLLTFIAVFPFYWSFLMDQECYPFCSILYCYFLIPPYIDCNTNCLHIPNKKIIIDSEVSDYFPIYSKSPIHSSIYQSNNQSILRTTKTDKQML